MVGTRRVGFRLIGWVLCSTLSACALPSSRWAEDPAQAANPALPAATARVELAIDAANLCVGNYTRTYDSPTVTPGDLLDAALIECQPYFAAHRGALHALAVLQLGRNHGSQDDTLAAQQAEHYSDRFRHIVRDTGLAVLVQRRSATPSLNSRQDEGELHL